jgi:hypothetical protein
MEKTRKYLPLYLPIHILISQAHPIAQKINIRKTGFGVLLCFGVLVAEK